MTESPFAQVIRLIDAANAQDPHLEQDGNGMQPKELLYALRMSRHLEEFAPAASDHLKIAARGQHIERWKSPRSAYPEGRSGYKKWRAELGQYHAQRVGEIMQQAGYPDEDIDRVKYLVQKRGLSRDPETQCLEDVICLVFLRYYLEGFARKHTHEKMVDIIRKTWGKMSAAGQSAALDIPLPPHLQQLIGRALKAERPLS